MRASAIALVLCAVLANSPLALQEGYRLPPQDIVDIVDASPSPRVSISPDGAWMLLTEQSSLPTIAEVARPMLRLAGLRIDPAANARHRTSFDRGLVLRDLLGEREVRIPLGDEPRLAGASWSHTSKHFAYTRVTDTGSELWVVSVDEPEKARRVTDRLNSVMSWGTTWAPDGESLYVHLVPEDRGAAPEAPSVPTGPNVQETAGDTSPLRTYQDLLTSPHDEALFEHYATTVPAEYDLETGILRVLGKPGLYRSVSPAPDGEHLLVTRTKRPFSYLMTAYSFPHSIEVWNRKGQLVYTVADVPLAENIPIGGVRTGRRSVSWKSGEPAQLVWVEALDGGDPDREVDHRDGWSTLVSPFSATTEAFRRGLLNSRREAHAEGQERLHLIGFDFSVISSALLGTMLQCVLAASEEGFCRLNAFEPVRALHTWSFGFDLSKGLTTGRARMADGRSLSLPDYIRELAETLLEMVSSGLIEEHVAPAARELLPHVIDLADALDARSLERCARHLDWAAKALTLLDLIETEGLDLADPAVRLADHDFCNTDPARGSFWTLWENGVVDPFVTPADVEACLRDGPSDGRGFARGRLVQRFGHALTDVDWGHVELRKSSDRWDPRLKLRLPRPDSLRRAIFEAPLAGFRDVRDLERWLEAMAEDEADETDPLRDVQAELAGDARS